MSFPTDPSEFSLTSDGTEMVYRLGYSPSFIRAMVAQRGLRGLAVESLLKKNLVLDLGFLRECDFLRSLSIISRIDYDFSVLRHLVHLEVLTIRCPLGENPIALDELRSLKSVDLWWRAGISGLPKCEQLKKATFHEIHADDVASPTLSESVSSLAIKSSEIRSLTGIGRATRLETLFVGGCSRLVDIDALDELQSLRRVTFSGCPKISRAKAKTRFGSRFELEFASVP